MFPVLKKMMGHPSMRLNVVSNSPPIDLVRRKVATNWPSRPRRHASPVTNEQDRRVSREFSAATMFTRASLRGKGSDEWTDR